MTRLILKPTDAFGPMEQLHWLWVCQSRGLQCDGSRGAIVITGEDLVVEQLGRYVQEEWVETGCCSGMSWETV
jgi:hypothetical protein